MYPFVPPHSLDNSGDLEQLKEVNLTIRHWETLLFDNAKSLFSGVIVAVGAAGAVVAWSTVGIGTQRFVVSLLLAAGIAISIGAILVISSTQNYLERHYERRHKLESRLRLAIAEPRPSRWFQKTGRTVPSIISCFVLCIMVCVGFLMIALLHQPERSRLHGPRLHGADLSMVSGLTQADLTNACGDAKTRLPAGYGTLPPCQQP